MIIQCWLSQQVYIRHYSVPLTVSHHPFFATRTVHFVEVRVSSVNISHFTSVCIIYNSISLVSVFTVSFSSVFSSVN